jgi:predicted nucleic acid-binding protein
VWIVDTCIVLDVFEHDPRFGMPSAKLLEALLPLGLAVCPVTMVELSPAFAGNLAEQKRFLEQAGISYDEMWTAADTEGAHCAWNNYVAARRQSRAGKRPVADLLIGAYAENRTGLVTRNAGDFVRWFPRLKVHEPKLPSARQA